MGKRLSEQEPPSNLPGQDIVSQAEEIVASALRAPLRVEIDEATRRAEGCGCPNCRRDRITVFDKVNDTVALADGRIHEPTLATGSGAVRVGGVVSWIENVPPNEWHIIPPVDRPHGSVSGNEDDGGID